MVEKRSSESQSQAGSGPAKTRPRSPGYPGIDLEKAIEKAKVIWTRDGRNEASEDTILGHWKYKPKSGPWAQMILVLEAMKPGLVTSGKPKENRKWLSREQEANLLTCLPRPMA